jgi:hypothetical protein
VAGAVWRAEAEQRSNQPGASRGLGALVGSAVLLLASWATARAHLPPCYAGFEVSQACIAERGLDRRVEAYRRKITEALSTLGASYKIDLRVVNHPVEAGYDATVGDVFTEVVRDDEMRNQSFIINVTADFLEQQPEVLFEASALHEVCHVMNDDLTGYHRNGASIEAAEEACVLRAVGEPRYERYLQAYGTYRHWDTFTHDRFLKRVKDVVLVPSPSEIDEADRIAAEYFRSHADGNEHLLVYNGELHDVTRESTRNRALHDPARLKAVIDAGKPMVFFHNHPTEGGRAAMFPSYDDFGVAALFSFMVYAANPDLSVDFRVMQLGDERTSVSYGFKGTALEEIKRIAREHRRAAGLHMDVASIDARQTLLDRRLGRECFEDYLQHACPVDLARHDAEVCRTHPQYFLWPSHGCFVHCRSQPSPS